MRIAIQTLGTRGDVQPYLALAIGLTRRGHDVQIAAPIQFEGLLAGRGLAFAPLPGEFLALLDTPHGKAALAGGQGFSIGLKLLNYVRPLMRHLLDAEWTAVRAFAPDLILHHPKSVATPHIAEALSCPYVLASPLPGFTPTSAFPSPILPFASLGPLNRASHALAIKGADLLFAKTIRAWREEALGLPGRSRRSVRSTGTLYAYSRHVVPVPQDWDDSVLVSGYWFLDRPDWRPSEDLAAFLGSGEPPVYVGFGSMPGLDPLRMTEIVLRALAAAGKRGLLATGGGALLAENLPPHVRMITEAPHDRLLPFVSATIHHGGAGTTAASLRAGKPTTICPFFGDQPFWARRMAELGVGPPSLDRKALSADGLAAAIAAMDDQRMRERARVIGTLLRAEDGIAAAVSFVEKNCPAAVSERSLMGMSPLYR
jgi:UDP:flavonoid glycosyltransferase YjiC (YdhE family)